MEYSAWKIKCRDCGKSSLRSEPSPCPKCYSKSIEVTKALSVMERISLAANFIPLIAIIFSGLWLFGVFDDEKPTKRVTTAAKTIDKSEDNKDSLSYSGIAGYHTLELDAEPIANSALIVSKSSRMLTSLKHACLVIDGRYRRSNKITPETEKLYKKVSDVCEQYR